MMRHATALLAVWMFFSGAPVLAGGTKETRAKKLFLAGKRFYQRKKYDEAIRLFKKAYVLWPHRSIRYNIALAYALKGDNVNAARQLRAYLKKATASERNLPAELERAQRRVSVLVVVAGHSEARIFVDGRAVGKQRVEVVTQPGRREVVVRVGGQVVARKNIYLPAGRETVWKPAGMDVVKPGPDPTHGKEPVRTAPARVEPVVPPPRPLARATTEPRPKPLPVVRPAVPRKPASAPPRSRLGRLHWAWFAAAASLAAAAAVAATATGIETYRIHKKWVNAESQEKPGLKDKGLKYQTTNTALWGVAGAFAVGSAVLAIFTRWKKPERENKFSASPLLLPSGGGVTLLLRH